ncbi:MAG: hypothetical protein M3Y82_10000 [Verrucomicrobiota bacterium]|nr:hypothetical protein [Verrucomicrobiota bacterium]
MSKGTKLILWASVIFLPEIFVLIFPFGRKKAEATGCCNQMIAICFAARHEWAEEHNGLLPSNLISMSNEIMVLKILVCPSDHSTRAATNWSLLTSDNSSYQIVTAGLRAGNTNGIFLRCKVHGFVGHADGAVYDGKRQLKK